MRPALTQILQDFIPNLRQHVLERLLTGNDNPQEDFAPSREDLAAVRIRHDRMYIHKRMQVNYTSYDMRREQDSINPDGHADIMLLAPPSSTHPYLYARVIGIFHVNAYLANRDDSEPSALHVLWVRWYTYDERLAWGFKSCRLPRVKFAPLEDEPFGFIAPDQVLRAVHLLPAFAHGASDAALPGPSLVRGPDEDDEDYNFYYVGMCVLRMLPVPTVPCTDSFCSFVDRDMFMRYLGGGIGHRPLHVDSVMPGLERAMPSDDEDTGGDAMEVDEDPGSDMMEVDEDLGDDPLRDALAVAPASDDDEDDEVLDDPDDEELDYGYRSSGDEDEPGGDLEGGEEDLDEFEGFAAP